MYYGCGAFKITHINNIKTGSAQYNYDTFLFSGTTCIAYYIVTVCL